MLNCLIRLALLVVASALFTRAQAVSDPVRVWLDTDIGNDIDDTLALGMIHAMENRGEAKLLGVTITKDNRYAAPFVDVVDTFYGRPHLPIGVVRNGKTRNTTPMIKVPAERRAPEGAYFFPHDLTDGRHAPEAVDLLRRMLPAQPDQSVVLIQIGFSTNLARLITSPGGRDLVTHKVKRLVAMAGNFIERKPEYNVYTDADSAATLLRDWPTPIVFSGFEIGLAVPFPYAEVLKAANWSDQNPIATACRVFFLGRENRAAWDPTAVLAAIRPDAHYFRISPPGRVVLGPHHTTVFSPDPAGHCQYLIVDPEGASRAQRAIVDLLTAAVPVGVHG